VSEAILNHVSGRRGGVVGVYQRHSWDAAKKPRSPSGPRMSFHSAPAMGAKPFPVV